MTKKVYAIWEDTTDGTEFVGLYSDRQRADAEALRLNEERQLVRGKLGPNWRQYGYDRPFRVSEQTLK